MIERGMSMGVCTTFLWDFTMALRYTNRRYVLCTDRFVFLEAAKLCVYLLPVLSGVMIEGAGQLLFFSFEIFSDLLFAMYRWHCLEDDVVFEGGIPRDIRRNIDGSGFIVLRPPNLQERSNSQQITASIVLCTK